MRTACSYSSNPGGSSARISGLRLSGGWSSLGQVPLPLPQVLMTGWYAQMMRQGLGSTASAEGGMFHCGRAAMRPEISSRLAYWSSRPSGLRSKTWDGIGW